MDIDAGLQALAAGGTYDGAAVERLTAALRREPAPRVQARRRRIVAVAGCLAAAGFGGAGAVAAVEALTWRSGLMLAAESPLTPSSLLFGGRAG